MVYNLILKFIYQKTMDSFSERNAFDNFNPIKIQILIEPPEK